MRISLINLKKRKRKQPHFLVTINNINEVILSKHTIKFDGIKGNVKSSPF